VNVLPNGPARNALSQMAAQVPPLRPDQFGLCASGWP
jgi:hypothetical protein